MVKGGTMEDGEECQMECFEGIVDESVVLFGTKRTVRGFGVAGGMGAFEAGMSILEPPPRCE